MRSDITSALEKGARQRGPVRSALISGRSDEFKKPLTEGSMFMPALGRFNDGIWVQP